MKQVKIIAQNLPAGFGFSIGDRYVKLDENISLEDAKLIASQHAGYVEIIDKTEVPQIAEIVPEETKKTAEDESKNSEDAKNSKKK